MTDLASTAQDMGQTLGRLKLSWSALEQTWKDEQRRSFEAEFSSPQMRCSEQYLAELTALAVTVERIERALGQ